MVKYVRFEDRQFIGKAQEMAHGACTVVQWGDLPARLAPKGLLHIMCGLPGTHIRFWTFDSKDKDMEKECMEAGAIDRGFNFLEEKLRAIPRRHHLRFITKEPNNKESPIYGWKPQLI